MERAVEREDQEIRECLIYFFEPFPQATCLFLLACWPWSLETNDAKKSSITRGIRVALTCFYPAALFDDILLILSPFVRSGVGVDFGEQDS